MAHTDELSAYWTAQADAVRIWTHQEQDRVQESSNIDDGRDCRDCRDWDDFQYGLCAWCSKGLEDKSDLVVTEDGYGNLVTLCYDCGSK
jgi:hypothetical protein